MRMIFLLIVILLSKNLFAQDSTRCTLTEKDKQLNQIYSSVIQKYKGQTLFLKRLKLAQRAWLQFRDAQIDARFPVEEGEDKSKTYGSVYKDCVCSELVELTKQRISQLEKWLKSSEEGDVCSGSYQ